MQLKVHLVCIRAAHAWARHSMWQAWAMSAHSSILAVASCTFSGSCFVMPFAISRSSRSGLLACSLASAPDRAPTGACFCPLNCVGSDTYVNRASHCHMPCSAHANSTHPELAASRQYAAVCSGYQRWLCVCSGTAPIMGSKCSASWHGAHSPTRCSGTSLGETPVGLLSFAPASELKGA